MKNFLSKLPNLREKFNRVLSKINALIDELFYLSQYKSFSEVENKKNQALIKVLLF